jgi:hypothetical protein
LVILLCFQKQFSTRRPFSINHPKQKSSQSQNGSFSLEIIGVTNIVPNQSHYFRQPCVVHFQLSGIVWHTSCNPLCYDLCRPLYHNRHCIFPDRKNWLPFAQQLSGEIYSKDLAFPSQLYPPPFARTNFLYPESQLFFVCFSILLAGKFPGLQIGLVVTEAPLPSPRNQGSDSGSGGRRAVN